jgi:hypothetical protein
MSSSVEREIIVFSKVQSCALMHLAVGISGQEFFRDSMIRE